MSTILAKPMLLEKKTSATLKQISSMGQTIKTQTKKRKSMNTNTKAISVLGVLDAEVREACAYQIGCFLEKCKKVVFILYSSSSGQRGFRAKF